MASVTMETKKMRSEGTIRADRKVIKSQAREMINNVREYFEKEKAHGGPIIPVQCVIKRTEAATKISVRTIKRISKEKEKNGDNKRLSTPGKHRIRNSPKTTIDSFQEKSIRRHIHAYYERKEYPTVRRLLASLKEVLPNGSSFSLRVILKRLSFKWKRFRGNRKLLLERSDIVAWRGRFLREIRNVCFEDIIWLGETCLNTGSRKSQTRTDAPRLILLHAGGSEGFLPNAKFLLKAKKNTGDYHNEISHITFKKWFSEQLIPNLKPHRTIVMDNAPYRSVPKEKYPSSNWRKEEVMNWLMSNNVKFDETMYKDELLELVNFHKSRFPTYEIDEIAKKHGHKVLRYPPYHCHFNAIDTIWKQIKDYVSTNSKAFTATELMKLTEEKIDQITAEEWKIVVEHTKEEIEEQITLDGILEKNIEEMIIGLASNCATFDDVSSDESGDESMEDDFSVDEPMDSDQDEAEWKQICIKDDNDSSRDDILYEDSMEGPFIYEEDSVFIKEEPLS